jgi:uncharacterized protein
MIYRSARVVNKAAVRVDQAVALTSPLFTPSLHAQSDPPLLSVSHPREPPRKPSAMPFLTLSSPQPRWTLLLAHGAGAAMDSPFLNTICTMLAEQQVTTLRFEFAYMAARRDGGKRRPPPKAELLMSEYLAAVAEARTMTQTPLYIGGKSMGGRVASLVAGPCWAAQEIAGLVCLGYPFHAPNTPDKLRTAQLLDLTCPALIIQGTRDPFGTQPEVQALTLSRSVAFHWADDGDHDLGPRGASGFTRKGNLVAATAAIVGFMANHPVRSPT